MDEVERVGRLMTDFLLELRCEEIPARMQAKASEDLARLFTEALEKAGLKPAALTSYVTPRRLALIARGLPLETEAVSEERKGPRANAPEQALAGFLRSTGLAREQLVERDGVLFAVIEKPGRPTAQVLAEAIPAVIRAFPWPKSMRWGDASISTESLRWVRPLQGIVAILGEGLVDIEIDGITSGFATLGHRFHHPGEITIGGADDYVAKLRACHVIVDQDERQAIIAEKAEAAAAAHGLTLVEDRGLVAENAGLTEWPVPLLGHFDTAFLDVPPEVIQLTLRTNQKYFVLRDAAAKLAAAFVCVANIEAKDGGEAIVAGNRKVLAARLSDARFFWEQDKKTPLAEQAKKLERITFHEKLGTVADKVDRVAKLARWLVEEGIVTESPSRLREGLGEGMSGKDSASVTNPPPTPPASGRGDLADFAEQAARLAKADLVTEMVGEFPELQGLMGGYYAREEGLPEPIADAIQNHYKPVGQGDDVPTAPVTVAVSLADKLDTLTTFFGEDMRPSGSKDPFALRRAAIAVLALINDNQLRLQLLPSKIAEGVSWSPSNIASLDWSYQQNSIAIHNDSESNADAFRELNQERLAYEAERSRRWKVHDEQFLDFFADRLKVQQREAGVRHDLIDAVFALGGEDDLVRLLARVKALQSFIATDDGSNLLAGYKRAANILKKEGVETAEWKSLSYTPETAEAALIAALDAAEPRAANAIAQEDFEGAMAALASLRAPIDAFFEGVTVNDSDPAKRTARLALLARVRDAVHGVADFSRIEG